MSSAHDLFQIGKNALNKLQKKGFSDIVFSTGINKILSLLATSLIVRILTKEDYGNYSYALNIISIVSIFSSFGLDIVMLQFASEKGGENEEARYSIYKFCFIAGAAINILFSIVTFGYATIGPLKLESARSSFLQLSFIFFFQFFYKAATFFHRAELRNKQYALTTNIHSLGFILFSVLGALLFKSAGVAIGRYLSFAVAGFLGFGFFKEKIKRIFNSRIPEKDQVKEMVKYGTLITATNAIAEILYYIDIFVIGLVVGESDIVAEYKVAMTIPFALNALPGIVVTFIFPYFARNKDNIGWIKRNYHKTILCILPFNALISIMGVLLAPYIIRIAFGAGYVEAVSCFRVLMISYFFSSTFRVISGNIIAMMRKVKVNMVLDSITSIVNIIVDYLLVKHYGSIGAAIASLAVVCLAGALSTSYLELLFKRKRLGEQA